MEGFEIGRTRGRRELKVSADKTMTRRAFLGTGAAAALLAAVGLAGCDNAQSNSADEATPEPSEAVAGGVLVAYFSATGNTEAVAQAVADELGADTFAVTPTQPYTADDLDYNSGSSRVGLERSQEGLAVELDQVTPDGFDAYDTVFVGYPIWWGDAAWPIDRLVSGNDFSGKRVIPFCTSGSSPIGSSGERLAELAGAGEWLDGERLSASDLDAAREWAASMV